MKLAFGDFGEHIPTNFRKGGMKEIVDRKRKGKSATNSYMSRNFNANTHAVGVRQEKQEVGWLGSNTRKDGKDIGSLQTLSEEDQRIFAEHIQR